MDEQVQNGDVSVEQSRGVEVFDGRVTPNLDVERALDLLSLVEDVVRDDVSYSNVRPDAESLDQSFSAAEQSLRQRLEQWNWEDTSPDGSRMLAVLMQLGVVRSTIKDALIARRQAAISGVSEVLHGFRSFGSLAGLVQGAPGALHQLGLQRALFSRIERGRWIATSGSVLDDPELTADMVRVGAERPGVLTNAMVESEMVRKRAPILVRDPQGNPRVHPELKALIQTQSYVSAPVMARGSVVGIVHADENIDTGFVGFYDRDILGMFAEGLGFAIERMMFYERLQGLRCKLNEHTKAVDDLIDEFVDADLEMLSPDMEEDHHDRPSNYVRELRHVDVDGSPMGSLTRRERQVLHRMALGETNLQIAAKLFVSVGTVKSHVKRILRKLDASNRAEAVSCYHMMMRESAAVR
ncbi:LuxR C-terminal-related transcriptional regulator [Haloechinothrix salitolerans]|uniref:LuxR C-terminal-related transcriptional regulator n=1 Tax=Haloechinothrix salitolerans TaxID=926830 RepID=A0ABW2BVK5_9PSEU